MHKSIFILILFCLFLETGCRHKRNNDRTNVLIETSYGDILIELYNETPKHRDNFIKLIKSNFYDDLLFHRVIQNFMIQGGDPESRNAPAGSLLGAGENGYLLDAELHYPRLYHKRGALAAAREGDDKNPEKRSSSCQFYIVQGKTFSDVELDELIRRRNEQLLQQEVNMLFRENEARFNTLEAKGDMFLLQVLMDSLRSEGKKKVISKKIEFIMPDSIRSAYKQIGGAPWLDNNYTVFGEVVDGLDVIDKIQRASTDSMDRPLEDIKMKISILE